MKSRIYDILRVLLKKIGVHMPTFNKGTFTRGAELIEYEAKPVKRFKISSIFRWYQPYAPGDAVRFTLSLKGIKGTFGGVQVFVREDGGDLELVANLPVEKTERIHSVPAVILGGQGSVDYYMKSLGFERPSVLLVSVKPSHNDAIMFLVMGGMITLIVEILAILIATGILSLLKR